MSYEASVMFEHRFWLQVFGDHARFIRSSLSPDEKEEIARAEHFIGVFDKLYSMVAAGQTPGNLAALNQAAYKAIAEIRTYKLHLLKRHLTEPKLGLHLPPTFVNHMVNEAEEALRTYGPIASGENVPVFSDVHLHLLWLLDAVGHSDSLDAALDPVEKNLKNKSKEFGRQFQHFYMKAVEMAGFLRTTLTKFPSLSRFNKEVELEMLLFRRFLNELAELDLRAETLGTLMPLMADHMAREECYYLIKLSLVSEVEPPNCDPGKPRIE